MFKTVKMKTALSACVGFSLAVGVTLSGCATLNLGGGYKIQVPDYKEQKLKNGMTILFVKDKKLPLVSYSLMVAPGAVKDPMGKSGLTSLMLSTMSKGTKTKNADQIADAFADLGTQIGVDTNYDYVEVGTSGLASTQQDLFKLFAEVVMQPSFATKEVNMMRDRTVAAIKQSYDDANTFADHIIERRIFGSHVYGRPTMGTARDVTTIRQRDVIRQYLNQIKPSNATLVVFGDYDKDLQKLVAETFAKWEDRSQKDHHDGSVETEFATAAGKLLLVDRGDLKQSQIRFGQPGMKRTDPDYWVAQVANVILGGNFSSRLMREVRVKRGLTYSVRSTFEDSGRYEGLFEVATFTRHEKVGETIQATMDVLSDFVKKGVTEEEVEGAKNFLRGHLIRGFENPADIISAMVRMRFYGLPESEVANLLTRVNDVDTGDVNRVIAEKFNPDSIRVVIYSPKSKVIKEVRKMGALEVRSYREFR